MVHAAVVERDGGGGGGGSGGDRPGGCGRLWCWAARPGHAAVT